jgi:hypothetical protein
MRICEGDTTGLVVLVPGPYGQSSVMAKFLALLTALVADHGAVSASLLPNVVELALQRLHPALADGTDRGIMPCKISV